MSEALLDKPSRAPAFAGGVVSLAWLLDRAAAWDRLVERALDPSPFYARPVVAAHAETGIASAGLSILAVRHGDDLAAALPFRPGAVRIGFGPRANVAWTSPYVTNATPLVADTAAVEALLNAMASAAPHRLWALPLQSLDAPASTAIQAAVRRRGWPCAILSEFERPVLRRRPDYDAYAQAFLKPNRRKGTARRRRRLSEQGRLAFRSVTDAAGVAWAVEAFLALEARGWKGRRRTALASHDRTAAFARVLFGRGAQGGVSPRADVLSLDGRPIAASLALVCAGTAHLLKSAYDEGLSAPAPGLVLEDEIIRAFHATAFADRLDTASVAGGVLDEIYGDRERIGDLLFATGARCAPEAFTTLVRREALRRAALKRIKRLAQGFG